MFLLLLKYQPHCPAPDFRGIHSCLFHDFYPLKPGPCGSPCLHDPDESSEQDARYKDRSAVKDVTGVTFTSTFAHAWHGTTAENQETADARLPKLIHVSAVVHFVSVEPMIGPINLLPVCLPSSARSDISPTLAAFSGSSVAGSPENKRCPFIRPGSAMRSPFTSVQKCIGSVTATYSGSARRQRAATWTGRNT